MKHKFAPEKYSQVLDLILFDGEDVCDKETTEKEEGVNREEALEDCFKGARVVHLIHRPHWVV